MRCREYDILGDERSTAKMSNIILERDCVGVSIFCGLGSADDAVGLSAKCSSIGEKAKFRECECCGEGVSFHLGGLSGCDWRVDPDWMREIMN